MTDRLWTLLRDTGSVLLDAADPALVREVCACVETGDARITDLHVWRVGPEAHAAIVSVEGLADADTVRAAEIAARTAVAEHAIRVEVIPTHAQVQGLAAISVHEPGRAFDADVREMTATARHARHGAVTVAARQAITMAGPCEPGDALGVIAGDFAVIGSDLEEVAHDVLERLLAGGGELEALSHELGRG